MMASHVAVLLKAAPENASEPWQEQHPTDGSPYRLGSAD
jgi:hypothetical protein